MTDEAATMVLAEIVRIAKRAGQGRRNIGLHCGVGSAKWSRDLRMHDAAVLENITNVLVRTGRMTEGEVFGRE